MSLVGGDENTAAPYPASAPVNDPELVMNEDEDYDRIHPPVESEMEEDGTEPEEEEDEMDEPPLTTGPIDQVSEEEVDEDEAGIGPASDQLPIASTNSLLSPSPASSSSSVLRSPFHPNAFPPLPSAMPPPRPPTHRPMAAGLRSSMQRGHHDPIMRSAQQAINNTVIQPNSLSHNARSLLLERQQSDSNAHEQQKLRSRTSSSHSSSSSAPGLVKQHSSSRKRTTSQHTAPSQDPLHPPPPESLSVFRLTALNQLLQHHARRGNFIMLDLDETLMITKHQPALLLSSYGVRMFQSYVRSTFSDFATKNRLCRQLEAALKDKVLVESDTAIVVAQLQKAGCWVFGVTARYPELATNTQRTLLSLGISLGGSAPFPRTVIKDPVTEAVFSDGVIYCGRESKAKVVSRFLENVVFAQLLQRAQQEAKAAEEQLRLAAEAETTADESEATQVAPPTPYHLPIGEPGQPQRSPSMVSLDSDSAASGNGTPSTSSPPSPSLSSSTTPGVTPGPTMTPLPDFLSPVNSKSLASATTSQMTPLPIDRVLRPRTNSSVVSPTTANTDPQTPELAPESMPDGLTQMPLLRSVSSPVASTPHPERMAAVALQSELTPSHSSIFARSSDVTQPSTLYRSATIARAMATPLYSATRGSRHRSRRSSKLGADSYDVKTPAKTPSSTLRRTMSSYQTTPLSAVTQTPGGGSTSTISKRQRTKSNATAARARASALRARRRIKVKPRVPRSALPPEVIFVDNEVQHVTEMQNLKIAKKLKIPLRCYCFAPTTEQELQQQQETTAQTNAIDSNLPSVPSNLAPMTIPSTNSDDDPVHPLQSPHTASIAEALSLASLTAPSAAPPSPAPSASFVSATSSSSNSGNSMQGIYGFMIALGNVLPSSTVSVTSPATTVPTPQRTNSNPSNVTSPNNPTTTISTTVSTSAIESSSTRTLVAALDDASEDETPTAASVTDETAIVPSKTGELLAKLSNVVAPVSDNTNSQLYDEDEAPNDTVEDMTTEPDGDETPTNSNHPNNTTATTSTADSSDDADEHQSEDHPTPSLHPSRSPAMSAMRPPRHSGAAASSSVSVRHSVGFVSSANDDTDADQTGQSEAEHTEDGTTEYTDATTEYTDETQTSCTETDGTESDVNRGRSNWNPPTIPVTGAIRPPLLMPAVKQRALNEPIPGLSTTESLEVAAAALGDESAAVLQVQMATFASSGIILTNQQALEKLHRQAVEEDDDDDEEDEEEEDEDEEDEDEESEEDEA